MRAFFLETFISEAAALTLDLHGYERSIFRNPGESDESFSLRIRNMTQALDPMSLKTVVDSYLAVGECDIIEHDLEGFFFDRDSFYNRRGVFSDIIYCAFTIIFSFQGAGDDGQDVLDSIALVVNRSKALGTLFRIVELSE
jgi:hypothetical protein